MRSGGRATQELEPTPRPLFPSPRKPIHPARQQSRQSSARRPQVLFRLCTQYATRLHSTTQPLRQHQSLARLPQHPPPHLSLLKGSPSEAAHSALPSHIPRPLATIEPPHPI